jgi:MerR family transcriptional regulator, copper efflux regulator
MRITEAADRLGLTPRMLRYRESLGLLPAVRHGARRRPARRPTERAAAAVGPIRAAAPDRNPRPGDRNPRPGGGHRQYSEADLAAVGLGLMIERRYDVSPVALAFAIRVLADQRVRAEVAELGRRIGKIQPPPARALDFEQERALRLLRLDRRVSDSARVGLAARSATTARGPQAPDASRRQALL